DDLNTVKTEYSRTANSTTYKDAKEKDINETKAVVNDPELDDNAEREQNEERYEKQQNKPIAHGDEESEYEETRKAGRGRKNLPRNCTTRIFRRPLAAVFRKHNDL